MSCAMAGCGDSSASPASTSAAGTNTATTAAATTAAATTAAAKTDKDVEKELEKAANELEKQDAAQTTTAAAPTITYEPTDEIKNADFTSGLIQIGNEVFQTGGYYTVNQFLEKYGEKYDTSAIKPDSYLKKNQSQSYQIISKEDPKLKFSVICKNDLDKTADKAKLGDCPVVNFSVTERNTCWFPTGICADGSNSTIENTPAFLEGKGYKKVTQNDKDNKYYNNYGMFWEHSTSSLDECVVRDRGAEKNLYGYYPIYELQFIYNLKENKVSLVKNEIMWEHYFQSGDLEKFTKIN